VEVPLAPIAAALGATAEKSLAAVEENDSIASYMKDLMERQRVKQLYGSGGGAAPVDLHRSVAPIPTTRTTGTVVAVELPKAAVDPGEPPKPISETPVHPQDKDAVRSDLSSLREVANQAARSAVLTHAKRKLRNHSLIKIGSTAAAFLTATFVFSGSIPATSMIGWAAVAIGGIMLVDLVHWTYFAHKKVRRPAKDRD
jgi:hypothetical protein